jgi:hypothetical protein
MTLRVRQFEGAICGAMSPTDDLNKFEKGFPGLLDPGTKLPSIG